MDGEQNWRSLAGPVLHGVNTRAEERKNKNVSPSGRRHQGRICQNSAAVCRLDLRLFKEGERDKPLGRHSGIIGSHRLATRKKNMMHKLRLRRRHRRQRFSSAVTDLPKHALCSRLNLSHTIQGHTPGNLCDDVRDLVKAATRIALEIKLYSLEVRCTSFLSNNHRLASGWKQHEAAWQSIWLGVLYTGNVSIVSLWRLVFIWKTGDWCCCSMGEGVSARKHECGSMFKKVGAYICSAAVACCAASFCFLSSQTWLIGQEAAGDAVLLLFVYITSTLWCFFSQTKQH